VLEQAYAGVVGRVALWGCLQDFAGAHVVATGSELGDDRLQLATRFVVGDGGPETLEPVRLRLVKAAAGEEPLSRERNLATG
jgi:hypothetical protein